MTRTKLIVTIGPASESDAMLSAMMAAGVDVFRLNFSHGTTESHRAVHERIRRLAAEQHATVAVLADLAGPKIRLGRIAGGSCRLVQGESLSFVRGDVEGTPQRLSSTYDPLIDDVQVGHRLLIDDGNVLLRAAEKQPDALVCLVEIGGIISDRKGINLPDTDVSAPALTEKDRADLAFIMALGVEFVALSFVRKPEDLNEVRGIIRKAGSQALVIAKIERPEAVERLESIVAASDVVMIARGDLGVELELTRVPMIQKEIARCCTRLGKPVIIATQMLQSMVDRPVPTRAEVSDVANAVLDDADAVMLSAETSVGQYPLQAVMVIQEIAKRTEAFDRQTTRSSPARVDGVFRVAAAMADGASVVAAALGTPLMTIYTRSGDSARLLSKHRPTRPVVAVTADEVVCRQMALLYGVIPLLLPRPRDLQDLLATLDRSLLDAALATEGQELVIVAGTRLNEPGETTALFVHRVGDGSSAALPIVPPDPQGR